MKICSVLWVSSSGRNNCRPNPISRLFDTWISPLNPRIGRHFSIEMVFMAGAFTNALFYKDKSRQLARDSFFLPARRSIFVLNMMEIVKPGEKDRHTNQHSQQGPGKN